MLDADIEADVTDAMDTVDIDSLDNTDDLVDGEDVIAF
jgi:hypothetical protein